LIIVGVGEGDEPEIEPQHFKDELSKIAHEYMTPVEIAAAVMPRPKFTN
jgi:hypothetical protein